MSYLVDSDWIVDYLQGRQAAIDLVATLTGRDQVGINLIAYGEVYQGIFFGPDPTAYEAIFRRLLRGIDVIGLNRTVMLRFARVRGDLWRRGEKIGTSDVLIAATALHYDMTLATRNLRHFRRIPGLKLYQPS